MEDDRKLVRDLLRGDARSFHAFFDRYAPLMLGFVLRRAGLDRASAEDVVQNAMVRAIRALPGYRGEASLYTWLCQICRSELADQRRAMERRPVLVSADQDRAAAAALDRHSDESTAPEVDLAGQFERVHDVLAALPEHQARVLELKYALELSVDEIAERMQITPIAAQSLLARARSAFRERWLRVAG